LRTKNLAHAKLQSSESTNRLKHKSVNIAQKLSLANRYNVHSSPSVQISVATSHYIYVTGVSQIKYVTI